MLSTVAVRKQIAHLDTYMKDVAKGDVSKLCAHTRSLLCEHNAAGESTLDLITNLIIALQKAPFTNFQRWFSNQIDLWSVRKMRWKEDGSDMMEEAELYFKEAKQTGTWGKKPSNVDTMYAFQGTKEDQYEDEVKEKDRKLLTVRETQSEIATLTAQVKQFNENNKWARENDGTVIYVDPR